MKSIGLLMWAVAIASLALVSGSTMIIGQEAFAVWNPGDGLPDSPKGHGNDVSRQAIGDPNIVPGAATGHGEEVSNEVTGSR